MKVKETSKLVREVIKLVEKLEKIIIILSYQKFNQMYYFWMQLMKRI